MRINIKVPSGLTLAVEIVAREVISAMKDSVILVESEAKVRTGGQGNLARTIGNDVVPLAGSVKGVINASAKYAPYVNNGTGLFGPNHQLIKPKTKQAMRWKGSGGYIYAKSTKGQPGKHFMEQGLAASKQRVEERFNEALQIAVKEMGR